MGAGGRHPAEQIPHRGLRGRRRRGRRARGVLRARDRGHARGVIGADAGVLRPVVGGAQRHGPGGAWHVARRRRVRRAHRRAAARAGNYRLGGATLYVTLEPSTERQGTSVPSITELILESGISRVVIGCPDPIPEYANKGASHLHASVLSVTMGVEEEECENLISEYASLAMTQLHRMARAHFNGTGRVSEYVVNFVRKRNKCCTPANNSLLSLPILPTPPFTASWFSTLQRH